MSEESARQPKLWQALIPILFLIVLLAFNVYVFGDEALDGSNQIVLLLAASVGTLVAFSTGYRWNTIQDGIVKSISSALSSMIILLLIGSLAATWMISGIVPAMIYFGLQTLNPTIFLVVACIVSALVSIATGSSWSTIATVGIALLGIGKTLGMSDGLVAGAIISGAYFGDKMSPLSDTTNLAPAMAGTDLFTHIRYMTYTTVPSITIALLIFLVWGFQFSSTDSDVNIAPVLAALDKKFDINGWLFIVPAVVIGMIVRKVSAIPALLVGTLLGGLFAFIFQPHVLLEIGADSDYPYYYSIMTAMFGDVSLTTDNAMVSSLLATGGMAGMLGTIWLIICAMIFGGVVESTGQLKVITSYLLKGANTVFSLVGSTVGTCILFNITTSDQYLSIVVPGRMYAEAFKKMGLKPEVLSRSLEDSGTVTSVLIPWNTCGATQSSILGVPVLSYLPYAFFNIISPFMTLFFAAFKIKIARYSDKKV
ncbi:MAG: Na+/H+ antiporter NhaC [Cyclobacteriaceae bacterium]|nr:Na+/H+ antiporter NhaC [Cyclobacteriaceae bacterium]MCH8517463.1 Na+/H+ antiporter NhaC [Cyclobacteriaceae bacterium]